MSDPSHKYVLIPTELQHENQEATFTGATLLHRASIHPHESIIIKSAKRRTLYFRTISMQRVPQDGTRHLGTLTPFTETSLSTPDKLTRPPRASSTEAGIPMCTCGLEEKMERGGKQMIPVVPYLTPTNCQNGNQITNSMNCTTLKYTILDNNYTPRLPSRVQ